MTPNHINFLRKDRNPNTNLSSDSEAVEFLKSVVSDTRTYAEAVYCYVNGLTQPPQCICGQLINRQKLQKYKFINILEDYNPLLTEQLK